MVKWSGSKNKKSKQFCNLPLKFGQNWVCNSWDIPDMEKCHLDKCCLNKCCLDKRFLDKCYHDTWNILNVPRNLHLKFIKIRSGTAEILLTLSFCGWCVGWGCKVIFKPNPTNIMLGWVVLWLTLCFDNE